MVATYGYFWVEETWGSHIISKPEASHIFMCMHFDVLCIFGTLWTPGATLLINDNSLEYNAHGIKQPGEIIVTEVITAQVVPSLTRHSPTAAGKVLIEAECTDSSKQGKVVSKVQVPTREQDEAFYKVDPVYLQKKNKLSQDSTEHGYTGNITQEIYWGSGLG